MVLPLVLTLPAVRPPGFALSEKWFGVSHHWPTSLPLTSCSPTLLHQLLASTARVKPRARKLKTGQTFQETLCLKQVNTGHLGTTYLVKYFPATASPRVKGWGHTVGRHDCLPPPPGHPGHTARSLRGKAWYLVTNFEPGQALPATLHLQATAAGPQ